jgi:hypothetical protein
MIRGFGSNWTDPTELIGHLLINGIPILLTAACGLALPLQSHELRAREARIVASCEAEAKTAAVTGVGGGESHPLVSDVSQPQQNQPYGRPYVRPYGSRGLPADVRSTFAERQAYLGCMSVRMHTLEKVSPPDSFAPSVSHSAG